MQTLTTQTTDGLTTLTLQSGKVNAINTELARDLHEAITTLEADDEVNGVVLAGRPGAFSAGLDVKMMATAGPEGLREFFHTYFTALRSLVRFPKPLVAAVTGYAPAGGTILALTADYRIMARGDKHAMGMNEFNMSLQIPRMMADIYAHYRGEAGAWADVQQARMYAPEAALALGLVDEVLEPERVLPRAQVYCDDLTRVHPPVYARTKRYLRQGLLQAVEGHIDNMVEVVAEDFDDPKFQRMIELFVGSLSSR